MTDKFDIPQEIIELHKHMDEQQKPMVRQIGDLIGYGRLMQLTELVWREKSDEKGLAGSEFTVGACATFMVPCKHWIKDSNGHCEICCGAGRVTEGVFKYMENYTVIQEKP